MNAPVHTRAWIVRQFDPMASNWGEWEDVYICLSREAAIEIQALMTAKGIQTQIHQLPVYNKEKE